MITPGVVLFFGDLAGAVTGCFRGPGSEQIPQEVSFLDICSKTQDRFIRILKKAVAVLLEKARSFRPSILASLERFKAESAEQDRQRRSAWKAVKDRKQITERGRGKSR
ncbi:MAG: hypothetical protein IJX90_03630 [Blautia sp.]|nr:hypothetical protein [Blautia sp.]